MTAVKVMPHEQYQVEAISWDLTMGAAATGIGKLLIRSLSSSTEEAPHTIDHVGVIVYNRLYEFGNMGIHKTALPKDGGNPRPHYPAYNFRKRELLGYTHKTREEFMEWLIEAKYGPYKGSSYDMVSHNCVDFAREVCQFLHVPYPPNWDHVSAWAKDNKKLVDIFTNSVERIQRRRASSPAAMKMASQTGTNGHHSLRHQSSHNPLEND